MLGNNRLRDTDGKSNIIQYLFFQTFLGKFSYSNDLLTK